MAHRTAYEPQLCHVEPATEGECSFPAPVGRPKLADCWRRRSNAHAIQLRWSAASTLNHSVKMADSGRDPVPNFLDLLQKKKWGRVAAEFNKLVEACKAAGLEPGKEQELRLRSSKAFKRMSKLMDNQEVVRGMLSILMQSPPNALQVMHNLGHIIVSAPTCFGAKVASSGNAAAVLRQAGDWILAPLSSSPYRAAHGPEAIPFGTVVTYLFLLSHLQQASGPFLQDAFEQRLPQQLVAAIPWGRQLSALKYRSELPGLVELAKFVAQAVRAPLNGDDNIKKFLSMVPAGTLGAWLVAFLDELRQMAGLLARRGEPGAAAGAQECAGLLLHLLQQMELLQEILHSSVRPSLKKTLQKLLPSLASHSDAHRQGTSLLLSINRLEVKSQLRSGPKPPLTEFTMVRKLLEQIEGSSGGDLDEAVLRFRVEMEGRSVSDHVAVLVQCDAVRRLHHAFRTGIESGVPVESIQSILTSLSVFLGIADLSSIPVGFDTIGVSLLSCDDRVINQLVQSSPNDLLGALVYCFNSGYVMQGKRTDVAELVIKCLDTDVPERLAGVIGWQFLAVLCGAIPQFRTSGFGIGMEHAPLYLIMYGAEFRPKHMPIRTSSEEINGQGRKLARLALRAFSQLGFSFEMPGIYPSSAALVLERLCRDVPELLTTFVLKEMTLIIGLLAQAYSKLAAVSREPPKNPTERILAEQLADLCSALSSIVKLCIESSDINQEDLIRDVARGKGLELCRSVMKSVRATGIALPVFLEPLNRAPGQSPFAALLEALVNELWDGIALAFDLKPCSNTGCANEVIESRKKTFKRCSVCGNVQYCTKNCQLVHWKKEHKIQCKKTSPTSIAT